MHDGEPYLFVSFAYGYESASEAGVPVPECWASNAWGEGCPRSLPASAAMNASSPPGPVSVQVIGTAGPCDARVGELVVLDTHGCEPSMTIARRLSGCTGPVASVGRIAGVFDPELRYVVAGEPNNARVVDAASAASLGDTMHRARVVGFLGAPDVTGGRVEDGIATHVMVDAGAEWLETSAATFLVAMNAEQCGQTLARAHTTGIRRGETFVPLAFAHDWEGVIAWRGRVVGIVAGAPHVAGLTAVATDGTVSEVYVERMWSDNEECGSGWAALEHPCGP